MSHFPITVIGDPGHAEAQRATVARLTTSTRPRVNVFNRTWWKRGPHGGRVPGAGVKSYMARNVSWSIGREIAREYNATHAPGYLSRKAELEEV